jgi:hypothetical protein
MTSHAKAALKTTRDREMHHALMNLLLPSSMCRSFCFFHVQKLLLVAGNQLLLLVAFMLAYISSCESGGKISPESKPESWIMAVLHERQLER